MDNVDKSGAIKSCEARCFADYIFDNLGKFVDKVQELHGNDDIGPYKFGDDLNRWVFADSVEVALNYDPFNDNLHEITIEKFAELLNKKDKLQLFSFHFSEPNEHWFMYIVRPEFNTIILIESNGIFGSMISYLSKKDALNYIVNMSEGLIMDNFYHEVIKRKIDIYTR